MRAHFVECIISHCLLKIWACWLPFTFFNIGGLCFDEPHILQLHSHVRVLGFLYVFLSNRTLRYKSKIFHYLVVLDFRNCSSYLLLHFHFFYIILIKFELLFLSLFYFLIKFLSFLFIVFNDIVESGRVVQSLVQNVAHLCFHIIRKVHSYILLIWVICLLDLSYHILNIHNCVIIKLELLSSQFLTPFSNLFINLIKVLSNFDLKISEHFLSFNWLFLMILVEHVELLHLLWHLSCLLETLLMLLIHVLQSHTHLFFSLLFNIIEKVVNVLVLDLKLLNLRIDKSCLIVKECEFSIHRKFVILSCYKSLFV